MENVLLGSVTWYWKKNGILFDSFSRDYLHVLLVYFKLQIGRVLVAMVSEGLDSASPL